MNSEWIEWDGGICPVSPTAQVHVKLRDGSELGPCAAVVWGTTDDPEFSNWHDTGNDDDVVAYRVVLP